MISGENINSDCVPIEATGDERGAFISDSEVMVEALKSFVSLDSIEALEDELLALGSVSIPVKHSFCRGIYTRQITIPKGTLAIGHAHSDECLNIVTAGSVSVVIDGKIVLVSAPACFPSAPLDRKVGYVHEDLTWITVHATNETRIEKLENDLIVKSKAFKRHEDALSRESCDMGVFGCDKTMIDRVDYFHAISELGFTHEQVVAISNNEDDMVDLPPGTGSLVFIATSSISGNGLFSSFECKQGDELCVARIKNKRTIAGKYVNHSKQPNCFFRCDDNGDVYLVASKEIPSKSELTVDYRLARKEAIIADYITKKLTQ